MGPVRLKREFYAEQWTGTNTTEVVDWIRRCGDASIRWYPLYEDGNRIDIPRWMEIPEHLVIVFKGGMIAVPPNRWIIRDEKGHYSVITDEQFRSDFEPTT
jgi:hypothetical protein